MSSSRSDGIVSSSVEFTVVEPAGRAGDEEEMEEWTSLATVCKNGLDGLPRVTSMASLVERHTGVSEVRFGSDDKLSLLFPSTLGISIVRSVLTNTSAPSSLHPGAAPERWIIQTLHDTVPYPLLQPLVQWVVLDIHSATLAPVFEIAPDIPHEAPLVSAGRVVRFEQTGQWLLPRQSNRRRGPSVRHRLSSPESGFTNPGLAER
jgi:hypothetical protein